MKNIYTLNIKKKMKYISTKRLYGKKTTNLINFSYQHAYRRFEYGLC